MVGARSGRAPCPAASDWPAAVRAGGLAGMIYLTSLACFTALLITGMVTDLLERRLPNWLTGGVLLLYPAFVLSSPVPQDWLLALLLAATVFLIGFGLFAFDLIGGGDVKLMAAVALWAGLQHAVQFFVVTALSGGVLALAYLLYRQALPWLQAWAWSLRARFLAAPTATPGPGAATPMSLPYGIAIAVGGLTIVTELLKL